MNEASLHPEDDEFDAPNSFDNGIPVTEVPLNDIPQGVSTLEGNKVLVYRSGDAIRACENACLHRQAMFGVQDIEDPVLDCPLHGWKLDVSKMCYVNPIGGRRQPELLTTVTAAGNLQLRKPRQVEPWQPLMQRQPLHEGEFVFEFFSHACLEIKCGDKRIITDPWCSGPAYSRGWWLIHRPPADWLKRCATADYIYISHAHLDHLNPHSISQIVALNPSVPFLIAKYEDEKNHTKPLLESLGAKNIVETEAMTWVDIGPTTRAMVIWDFGEPLAYDTSLYIEHKGHRYLNTVDCINPNLGHLPTADFLSSSFSSGASSFPSCFGDMLSTQKAHRYADGKSLGMRKQIEKWIDISDARCFIGFASYMTEAHKYDKDVKALNKKVKATDVKKKLEARFAKRRSSFFMWAPAPGERLDAFNDKVTPSVQSKRLLPPLHETMAETDALHEMEMRFPPLQTLNGVRAYFDWAKRYALSLDFKQGTANPALQCQPLIVHCIEQDDALRHTYREWYVDLRTFIVFDGAPTILNSEGGLTVDAATQNLRYLRIRCRATSLRRILRTGEPWDDFKLGFQARFKRVPDVFNESFWEGFTNQLPQHSKPDWGAYNTWSPEKELKQVKLRQMQVFVTVATCTIAVLAALIFEIMPVPSWSLKLLSRT